ncbi:TetR/AcrR family transcriptional regulator [Streptomonospora nanhaiensis]|uniref:AcrR family transcriptional regulator n=1 Tax=Streptomonospora nanhaiensis TaxID=1323731 RepID=A0A853BSW5_9ACTN|nr:TetR/AcrR family transcriptional regulator [Streptomonospora nanhaiensis]MBV2362827.1 TetR/AcrR family transcriptional regulator [Streptomonospora nanhaiensis]MBX9386996.1 TetR/AcrR family transcriptional regulator [Streptomonospora nanhaiensis]NYI97815.1 AcrR family transcriptional regulator [Streptomonospora nanhaiensis]
MAERPDAQRPRRRGRPPATSQEDILAAAWRLIEAEGWESLTIRSLARELGIGAATIYHHVRDREDLLVRLISDYAAGLPRPDLPSEPRARVCAATIALHDALRDLPWAAEVLTVDGFVGRLSDEALWFVEAILDGARRGGCTADQAVALFRNLWYLTVGELLVHARTRERTRSGVDRARLLKEDAAPFDGRDPEVVPQLASIGRAWPALAAKGTYTDGIRALVHGALDQLPQRD